MTEAELVQIIAAAMPQNSSNAETLGKLLLKKAILKIGRMQGVQFNREWVPFSLKSGKQDMVIGSTILNDYPGVWNMQEMWRTDTGGWNIPIVGIEDFQVYAAGRTTSGAPYIATLHSQKGTLTVYPIPDQDYPVKAYVRRKIVGLEDVPDMYHDTLADYGVIAAQALSSPQVAAELLRGDLKDLLGDALTGWSGSTIGAERGLAEEAGTSLVDSGNLRG